MNKISRKNIELVRESDRVQSSVRVMHETGTKGTCLGVVMTNRWVRTVWAVRYSDGARKEIEVPYGESKGTTKTKLVHWILGESI